MHRDHVAPPRRRRSAPHRALGLLPALVLGLALGAVPPGAAARTVVPELGDSTSGQALDATTTVLEGIDVSNWQGTIDWTKVAAAGKKFAIIKATESTDFVDPMYSTNHASARAAGLWTGAYHFAQPDPSANDAVNEADKFVSVVNLGTHDLIRPSISRSAAG